MYEARELMKTFIVKCCIAVFERGLKSTKEKNTIFNVDNVYMRMKTGAHLWGHFRDETFNRLVIQNKINQ